jgi:hypothetical protein
LTLITPLHLTLALTQDPNLTYDKTKMIFAVNLATQELERGGASPALPRSDIPRTTCNTGPSLINKNASLFYSRISVLHRT